MRIELPWPPSKLLPNRKTHWRKKAEIAAKHRRDCLIMCQGQGARALNWPGAKVSLTFRPPDNRRRDLDGMLSAFKQGLDALAEATGIDDSKFALTITKGEPVRFGRVVVEITHGE